VAISHGGLTVLLSCRTSVVRLPTGSKCRNTRGRCGGRERRCKVNAATAGSNSTVIASSAALFEPADSRRRVPSDEAVSLRSGSFERRITTLKVELSGPCPILIAAGIKVWRRRRLLC